MRKHGFVIVDRKDAADAILSGEASIEITLHRKRDDPPDRAFYQYRLVSSNNRVLWKRTVKFISKNGWIDNNKEGASKIAERLSKDWLKARESQKKARETH